MNQMSDWLRGKLSRRALLAGGIAAAGGSAIGVASAPMQPAAGSSGAAPPLDLCTTASVPHHMAAHGAMMTVGDVDYARNGFDPTAILTDWELGTVEMLPGGGVQRSFEVVAEDKEIEIAPGLMFPAWTYNGRVPGPSLRAREGERLRITLKNYGSHPHSMHFHGIHAAHGRRTAVGIKRGAA